MLAENCFLLKYERDRMRDKKKLILKFKKKINKDIIGILKVYLGQEANAMGQEVTAQTRLRIL